jgi:hypothetical protein
MDFRTMLKQHKETEADLTIATTPVEREAARAFGLMHADDEGRITRFVEKPKDDDALLDQLTMPPTLLKANGIPDDSERFQASMGIYLFNRKVMEDALDNDQVLLRIKSGVHQDRPSIQLFRSSQSDLHTRPAASREQDQRSLYRTGPAFRWVYHHQRENPKFNHWRSLRDRIRMRDHQLDCDGI